MGEISVSVAIPALNEEHYLPVLLRSLCAQRSVRLDVVVVEGNSDDKTVEAARKVISENTNPNVEIRVYTTEIRNVSVQRNQAVGHTRFDTLLFLDCDTAMPHKHWVRDVVRKHRYRNAAVSTCRFRPVEKNPIGHLYYNILFAFHQVMRLITPYAIGAMLLTSRRMYDAVGGFDEGLVVNEDANFVKRIARLGRFDVLPDTCRISARRFLRGGFFQTGIMYLRIFIHRTIHGECKDDMGYWNDQTYDAPPV